MLPSLPLSSILVLNRLDEVHPHWGGQSGLLSPLIQMLASPGNTPTDTPRTNTQPNSWVSQDLSSWHTKLTIPVPHL